MKSLSLSLSLFVKISCLLSLLGLGSCASRTSPLLPPRSPAEARRELRDRVQSSEPLAILFIGNSYSFGLPRTLAKIAKQNGKSVRIGHSTYGGWMLSQHSKHEPTLRKIREGQWDIVVIQEQSLIPSFPRWQRDFLMLPPLRRLAEESRKSGAIPVLYQTWGRRDGNSLIRKDDFLAMNQRLREGYTAASAAMGNLIVVPAGDAWEKEAHAGRLSELFLDDGSHPSEAGNLITATAFYHTFFGS